MAIKDVSTNEYYKVIYEECYICESKVFVTYQKYISEAERIKEQKREAMIDSAIDTLLKKRMEIDFSLCDILGKGKRITGEMIDELRQTNVQFNESHEEMELLDRIINQINEVLYDYGDNLETMNFPKAEAIRYGVSKEILEEPIGLGEKCTLRCGVFQGDMTTPSLFYGFLKSKLSIETVNC